MIPGATPIAAAPIASGIVGGDPVTHATTGALVGQIGSVAGTAQRFRAFATSGDLIGQGSVVVGTAARFGVPVAHATSGALVGSGSLVAGIAVRGIPANVWRVDAPSPGTWIKV